MTVLGMNRRNALIARIKVLSDLDVAERHVIEAMTDGEVSSPEPTDAECRRYYDANKTHFIAGQALHVTERPAPPALRPLLSLVREDLGIALTTPMCLWQSRYHAMNLKYLHLNALRHQGQTYPPLKRTFYLVYRPDEVGPLAQDIAAMVRVAVRDLDSGAETVLTPRPGSAAAVIWRGRVHPDVHRSRAVHTASRRPALRASRLDPIESLRYE